ncbi:MAG: 6-phosphofructokinase [Bdellovibrionales bacterium]|nr:6-phosphofructokinase [Bdellovibrionales bacterium]
MSKSSNLTIGVYTSGGDAPGMNAAIRAVVRSGIDRSYRVVGVLEGYRGMIDGQFKELTMNSMANIIQRGGTVLKTGRSPEFLRSDIRKRAATHLKQAGIDALVCIGGDGSFAGAHALAEDHKIPIIGIPATIDNDIFGTDATIGFDTAVNTALSAIDRIRDTAASHNRLFIVEVMGKASGFIATHVGLAGGAEGIFIPEIKTSIESVINHMNQGIQRGKRSSILVIAEGEKPGSAYDLADQLKTKAGVEAKVCILGHIQRGGSPTAIDRILASRLGAGAVEALANGKSNLMVGIQNEKLTHVPLADSVRGQKEIDKNLIDLSQILSK